VGQLAAEIKSTRDAFAFSRLGKCKREVVDAMMEVGTWRLTSSRMHGAVEVAAVPCSALSSALPRSAVPCWIVFGSAVPLSALLCSDAFFSCVLCSTRFDTLCCDLPSFSLL
jgi:hypothetical protein